MPGRRPPICRSMNSPRLHAAVSGTDEGEAEGEAKRGQGIQLAEGSEGWALWAWDEKRYMVAREPGAIAAFEFVTAETEAVEVEVDEGPMPDPIAEYEPHAEGESGWDDERRRRRRSRLNEHGLPEVARRTAKRQASASANLGTVAVGYQRSAHYGLGSVWCWVDEDRSAGKRLDGWWEIKERNMGIVDKIATGLAPGRHRLQCELLDETRDPQGRKEFRIFAIMHD